MGNREMGSDPNLAKKTLIHRGDASKETWGGTTMEAAGAASNVIATKRGVGEPVVERDGRTLRGTTELRTLAPGGERIHIWDARRLAKKLDKLKSGESIKGRGYTVTADKDGFSVVIDDSSLRVGFVGSDQEWEQERKNVRDEELKNIREAGVRRIFIKD